MSHFNITPQYTSQVVPETIINSTITTPPIVNDEPNNFAQPPPPEIHSVKKPHNYHF